MMTRLAPALSLLLAASSFVACTSSSSSAPDDPTKDIAIVQSTAQRNTTPVLSPNELDAFATDQAAFAIDLYQAVRKDPSVASDNVFLSPHSVSIALAMTYAGARGDTAAEMKKALHFGLADDRLHTAFDYLDLALESRGQGAKGKDAQPFRLKVANSIWGQKGFSFESGFLDTLAVSYGAGLNGVDFAGAPAAARGAINGWVEKKTEDRIKDLIASDLPRDTRMVLVNAVYFNAAWQTKFFPENTSNEAFTKLDGSTVDVPMMQGTELRGYTQGDGFQATELPYDGGELSMLVIAPTKGTFASFESSLTGEKVLGILAGLQPREVQLSFPKLKLDGSFHLASPLGALGMQQAFVAGKANFSGITKSDDLFIGDVVHKTFLELDENGTEAAAATAVILGGASAPTDPPAVMKVDRPYFVAIVDRETKTLAFFGRVLEPKTK